MRILSLAGRTETSQQRVNLIPRLCPHESPETDVVLLGHSMGGILAAEVVLLSPYSKTSRNQFRHRILGTVNFDTPFLGMHPGVVISGIGSLFRPSPETPGANSYTGDGDSNMVQPMPPPVGEITASSTGASPNSPGCFASTSDVTVSDSISRLEPTPKGLSPLASPVNDPNFNPAFPNDVRIATRKGWDSTLHFIMKHSDGLAKATKSYVTSHLDFGGCLADYAGLKSRYAKIRGLEDVERIPRDANSTTKLSKRVRFVNYYTASTGRMQKVKPPPIPKEPSPQDQHDGQDPTISQDRIDTNLTGVSTRLRSRDSGNFTQERLNGHLETTLSPDQFNPTLSLDIHRNEIAIRGTDHEMKHMEQSLIDDMEHQETDTPSSSECDESVSRRDVSVGGSRDIDTTSTSQLQGEKALNTLSPVPSTPVQPAAFDPSHYDDKDERKVAEKEHSRRMKAFHRAVKDRDKAVRDRRKLAEKREKTARQSLKKNSKEEKKLMVLDKKEAIRRKVSPKPTVTLSSVETPSAMDVQDRQSTKPPKMEKVKRDKKFCMLPPRSASGEGDKCWPRVFMEGVDEVGAHCGLFFSQNAHYERFVEDVGERVALWVREAALARGIIEGEVSPDNEGGKE